MTSSANRNALLDLLAPLTSSQDPLEQLAGSPLLPTKNRLADELRRLNESPKTHAIIAGGNALQILVGQSHQTADPQAANALQRLLQTSEGRRE
jgi:hypothetical protein